ncbi:MAG: cupredoxin domain-containing protein [Candidatus Dojkabacteria bacterium]|nr:MAG: cupredoxin domain-containing protein [Candidatus Dojkabacteria bacterium]
MPHHSAEHRNTANMTMSSVNSRGIAIIIVATFLSVILGTYVFFSVSSAGRGENIGQDTALETVYIREDGVQIVEIKTKGGFSPSQIEAKAGVPTLLRFKTSGTFDCSAALTIPSLGVHQTLPPTADTDIEVVSQDSGAEIIGGCSGGTYGFRVVFM